MWVSKKKLEKMLFRSRCNEVYKRLFKIKASVLVEGGIDGSSVYAIEPHLDIRCHLVSRAHIGCERCEVGDCHYRATKMVGYDSIIKHVDFVEEVLNAIDEGRLAKRVARYVELSARDSGKNLRGSL